MHAEVIRVRTHVFCLVSWSIYFSAGLYCLKLFRC